MNEITENSTPLTTGICHVLSQLWSSGSAWSIISMTPSLSPLLCLSSVIQEWIDVLTNAITYAIHNQTPLSTDDTLTDDIPNSPVDPTPTEIDKLVIQTMYMYSIASLNGHSL